MDRRTVLFSAAAAVAGVAVPGIARGSRQAVRIGLLLPLTGPDAGRGRMVRNAAILAVDEINRRAGRDGHFIVALVEDSRSDAKAFGQGLRRLVGPERVASVFGLCPDESRDDLLRTLERMVGLFWDPAPYGGGECSKHVIHGGATPHQSLKHLVPWTVGQVGGRLMLVGGEGAYPRELMRVCRDVLSRVGAEAVGRDLVVPAQEADFTKVIERMRSGAVDAVFCALDGDRAVALLRQVKAAGIDPRATPIVSPTLSEMEVAAAGHGVATGHIAVQPWFATWMSPESWRFMDRMRRRHGGGAQPSALAESAWIQVHLFAAALGNLAGGDIHPVNLREAAKDRELAAPQGRVRIERDSLHTVLWPKIAVVEPSGRFKVLARAGKEVRPLPFWAHPNRACTDTGLRHLRPGKRRSGAKTPPPESE